MDDAPAVDDEPAVSEELAANDEPGVRRTSARRVPPSPLLPEHPAALPVPLPAPAAAGPGQRRLEPAPPSGSCFDEVLEGVRELLRGQRLLEQLVSGFVAQGGGVAAVAAVGVGPAAPLEDSAEEKDGAERSSGP
ncbi:unnamed protein product [Prorocentrum cordatum]|uniref:Uncharacterized protein n=1 Tax=Prorocentrum cordatum TaxID=2364126 RepID=A0ABN9SBB2_9DINO|nr:unnamed protein product [Polarella glacialis]